MESNPYKPTLANQPEGCSARRRWWSSLARSGAWIGLLSMGIGIAFVVWLLNRVPLEFIPPRAFVFLALVACPYLIIAVASCFVSSLPAKAVLFVALIGLVATTFWQFSIRDAQAATIIFFQFPGAITTGILALVINLLTRSR